MTFDSFCKLLDIIQPALLLDEVKSQNASFGKDAITLEIQLHCGLRFLAGGSYQDIHHLACISHASFYCYVWRVCEAIDEHPQLELKIPNTEEGYRAIADGFRDISSRGVIYGCVGALDGWLCTIQTPPKGRITNPKDYFSGHYHKMGINVQVMCDSHCSFMFVGVMCPGQANNVSAYDGTQLKNWVES
jgi:hypothetical protein